MKNFTHRQALALGAVLLSIGAIAPWITVFGLISAGPSNFTEVALFVFGGIGLVCLSAITRHYMRPVSIVIGLLILAQVVYVWFGLSEQDTNELVTPGWGLWLTTAACLYLIASTFIVKSKPMERYRIASVTVAPNLDVEKSGSVAPPKSV
jgi:hypothetical protein